MFAHRRGHLNPAGSYLRAIGQIRWEGACALLGESVPRSGCGHTRLRLSLSIIGENRLKLGLTCDDASLFPNDCASATDATLVATTDATPVPSRCAPGRLGFETAGGDLNVGRVDVPADESATGPECRYARRP